MATVESHGWYRLAPFRWSAEEGVLRRAEVLDGAVTELAISVRNGKLHVRGAQPGDELTARITRMFQLHLESELWYSVAEPLQPGRNQ